MAETTLLGLFMLFHAYHWIEMRLALRYATFAAARTVSVYQQTSGPALAEEKARRSFAMAYTTALGTPASDFTVQMNDYQTASLNGTPWVQISAAHRHPLWCSRPPWSKWFNQQLCPSSTTDRWETAAPLW